MEKAFRSLILLPKFLSSKLSSRDIKSKIQSHIYSINHINTINEHDP